MHASGPDETIDIRHDVSGAARGKRHALDTKSTVMTRVSCVQHRTLSSTVRALRRLPPSTQKSLLYLLAERSLERVF